MEKGLTYVTENLTKNKTAKYNDLNRVKKNSQYSISKLCRNH